MSSGLSEVLSYQNDELVHRFAEDFKLSFSDAQEIFLETKRWLWLCARQRDAIQKKQPVPAFIPLLSEAYVIDLMWHTFLLFTKDYAEFCDRYFGFFIHHTPQTRAERESWQLKAEADPAAAMQERRKSLRQVYEYIHDELGADVLVRWFETYPERFKSIGG
ncbi:MAG: hypothetical protein P4M08_01050 [Oligoflexia bacterium]|nr:hypothetical protein [Oligoflexia bacterium]